MHLQVGVVNLLALASLYQLHYDECNNPLSCNQKAVSYTLLSYALGASVVSVAHRIGVTLSPSTHPAQGQLS